MPATGVKTYYPVNLAINANSRAVKQTVLRAPKAFGGQPIGYARQSGAAALAEGTAERLANLYAAAEDDLRGIYDVDNGYTGRAEGPAQS